MKDADYRVLVERISALDRLVEKSFRAAQLAIDKADAASERRFESVNEFRATLADQQRTLVTKSEADTFTSQSRADREALHSLYQELRVAQTRLVTRDELESETSAIRSVVDVLQGSVNRLLITLLSSFVLLLVSALIFDVTHR